MDSGSSLYYAAIKGYVERGDISQAIRMMQKDWESRGKELSDATIRRFFTGKGFSSQRINRAIRDCQPCR